MEYYKSLIKYYSESTTFKCINVPVKQISKIHLIWTYQVPPHKPFSAENDVPF